MEALGKEQLQTVLQGIDEEASLVFGELSERLRVVVAGGSAFMLRDLTRRPVTHDIDLLESASQLREIMAHYPVVNSHMAAFCDSIPYNFEDRLVPLDMETKAILYLTPSLEDLVVMKLYAWRPNDVADITSPSVLEAIDWGVLERLIYDPMEAQASCLSERRYQELVATFEQYRKAWKR